MDTNKEIKHLGLIPDGSRRWAKRENKAYLEAYIQAMDLLYCLIDFAYSQDIPIQSVYALSKDNLKRSNSDLEAVFKAEEYFFSELLPKLSGKWGNQVIPAGDLSILPSSYKDSLVTVCKKTQNNLSKSERKLYVLAGYSPWDEITAAINMSSSPAKIRENFWVKEDVDLVIRTGHGLLISNFLPLQSGYAELSFIPKLFNDMTIEDLNKVLREFSTGGERLLGK